MLKATIRIAGEDATIQIEDMAGEPIADAFNLTGFAMLLANFEEVLETAKQFEEQLKKGEA